MALNVEFNHQSKRVKVTPGTTMVRLVVCMSVCFTFQLLTGVLYPCPRSSKC